APPHKLPKELPASLGYTHRGPACEVRDAGERGMANRARRARPHHPRHGHYPSQPLGAHPIENSIRWVALGLYARAFVLPPPRSVDRCVRGELSGRAARYRGGPEYPLLYVL